MLTMILSWPVRIKKSMCSLATRIDKTSLAHLLSMRKSARQMPQVLAIRLKWTNSWNLRRKLRVKLEGSQMVSCRFSRIKVLQKLINGANLSRNGWRSERWSILTKPLKALGNRMMFHTMRVIIFLRLESMIRRLERPS